ncbi:hypothetical protein BLNAU_6176 [Blattamonas nauphoetae]|uniref:Transposase n=1 Tax=Blattamonas nauphoetae TaxID=2049346 RepID=A0ABQ9Y5A3_9EUKA|nr:hypothetical protein BLNAU_6176 [Blattamonas nauphoetae]
MKWILFSHITQASAMLASVRGELQCSPSRQEYDISFLLEALRETSERASGSVSPSNVGKRSTKVGGQLVGIDHHIVRYSDNRDGRVHRPGAYRKDNMTEPTRSIRLSIEAGFVRHATCRYCELVSQKAQQDLVATTLPLFTLHLRGTTRNAHESFKTDQASLFDPAFEADSSQPSLDHRPMWAS